MLLRAGFFFVIAALMAGISTACTTGVALPPAAVAHNLQGAEALAAGDLEAAGANLSLALEYNPDFVEALANLATVELQRGNFTRSQQLLLRARRLNPDFAQAHHGLGVLAEGELRLDDASTHYREALSVNPGFVESRANLGRLLFEAGNYHHALIQFRRLLQIAPDNLPAHRGFVATLLSLGRLSEAESALQRALALGIEDGELTVLNGRILLNRGDLAGAKQELLPIAETASDAGALALAWLAVIELAQDRPAHAAGAAKRSLSLEPNEPVATYALAVAAAQLDDPHAAEWLDRALALSPENPVLQELRAAR